VERLRCRSGRSPARGRAVPQEPQRLRLARGGRVLLANENVGYDRALQFAEEQRKRGKVERPAVVGALLQLGNCFDLMDTRCTTELRRSFPSFRATYERKGWSLPHNSGVTRDRLLRRRDCAVINFYLETRSSAGSPPYDSVRGCFTEGEFAFEGRDISIKSHVQIAIRNEACILGIFRPGGIAHEANPIACSVGP
jgi:hypothetical protein